MPHSPTELDYVSPNWNDPAWWDDFYANKLEVVAFLVSDHYRLQSSIKSQITMVKTSGRHAQRRPD